MFRDIYVCVAVLQCWLVCALFFFFKQKTAYEMRISDWSSDVCSSDLATGVFTEGHEKTNRRIEQSGGPGGKEGCNRRPGDGNPGSTARIERHLVRLEDRQSVGEGKSVSGRVDPGCRRIIKKKKIKNQT